MGKAPLPHNKGNCYPPYTDNYLINLEAVYERPPNLSSFSIFTVRPLVSILFLGYFARRKQDGIIVEDLRQSKSYLWGDVTFSSTSPIYHTTSTKTSPHWLRYPKFFAMIPSCSRLTMWVKYTKNNLPLAAGFIANMENESPQGKIPYKKGRDARWKF